MKYIALVISLAVLVNLFFVTGRINQQQEVMGKIVSNMDGLVQVMGTMQGTVNTLVALQEQPSEPDPNLWHTPDTIELQMNPCYEGQLFVDLLRSFCRENATIDSNSGIVEPDWCWLFMSDCNQPSTLTIDLNDVSTGFRQDLHDIWLTHNPDDVNTLERLE